MKYIWLGIKDYCKDCWHDFLFRNLQKYYKRRPIFYINDKTGVRSDLSFWKEGNLQHYIQQRKVANLLKEIKRLQQETQQRGK